MIVYFFQPLYSSLNNNPRERNCIHRAEILIEVFIITCNGDHRCVVCCKRKLRDMYLPTIPLGIIQESITQTGVCRYTSPATATSFIFRSFAALRNLFIRISTTVDCKEAQRSCLFFSIKSGSSCNRSLNV